jgi:hypothetical protein
MSDNIITIDDQIDLTVEDAKREVLRLRAAVDTIFDNLPDDDHTNIDALSALLTGLEAAFRAIEEVEEREFIF